MYVERNSGARSCNHRSSGRAICFTHSKCVFVDLGNQHAMRMGHIFICGVCGSIVFFNIIS